MIAVLKLSLHHLARHFKGTTSVLLHGFPWRPCAGKIQLDSAIATGAKVEIILSLRIVYSRVFFAVIMNQWIVVKYV